MLIAFYYKNGINNLYTASHSNSNVKYIGKMIPLLLVIINRTDPVRLMHNVIDWCCAMVMMHGGETELENNWTLV